MQFMIMVKSNPAAEAGVLPDEAALSEMGRFNEEMVSAGVMITAEGLQASSKGTRIRVARGKTTVLDGPFTEAKEVIAGYWLVDVPSMHEALEWARRSPFREGEVEVRPIVTLEDLTGEPEGSAAQIELRETVEAAPPQRKPGTTRYITFLMADENTESGTMRPSEALMAEMGALMTEMVERGALLAGDGLQPSRKGARVRYDAERRTVIDGPFTEAKELVAGFSVIQVETKEEAVEFARRMLRIHMDGTGIDHGQIEVRQVFELSDFPVDPAEDPEGWRKLEQRIHDGLVGPIRS